ncbi:MAG: ATP-binding protein [Spirochaetota bacterium]
MKLTFFLYTSLVYLFAQQSVLAINCNSNLKEVPKSPVSIEKGWLYRKGDSPNWKRKNFHARSGWKIVSFPDASKDKNSKKFGYYWYRCKFSLSNKVKNSDQFLAFRLGYVRDVDWVYLNGNLIGNTGQIAPTLKSDRFKDRVYPLPKNMLTSGENVIAIRIYSSTAHRGLNVIPEIGEEKSIHAKVSTYNLSSTIFGFVFILMGLFFVIASVVKSTNKSNLFFSIFSILLGIYVLHRSEYRYQVTNDFDFSMKIELLSLLPLPALFLNFIAFHVGYQRNLYFLIYEVLILALWGATLFSSQPIHWDWIININAALLVFPFFLGSYIIYKNFAQNKSKMKYIAIGFLFVIPCVIVDALTAIHVFAIPGTMHYGFMLFLINISLQLSEDMVDNYRSFLKQEKDLIQMERLKTNFLYNISAEFKHYTEKVLQLVKKEKANKINEISETKLQEMEIYTGLTETLIQDALLLNDLENKQYEIKTDRFSLNQLLEEVNKLVSSRLSRNSDQVNLQISTGELEILQCRDLLFYIFYHLLENAYQYSPPESPIQVKIDTNGTYLTLLVSDTGSGISEKDRVKIFKKFVRGNNTSKGKEIFGTGIGLNIIRQAVATLNGKISLESNGGKGAKFIVTLPYKQ